jgi:adenosylcobalamin-dependent ribonucleoside-diphosphate reductase
MGIQEAGMLQELLTEQDRYYDKVLCDKYAKGDERTAQDVYRRVARGLAGAEPEAERARREQEFLEAMTGGFCPAGRIMSAAGTDIQATLINCFVQPVGDSIAEVRDGRAGIYTALLQAAETMRRGGGVGYDFSAIRPRGARVAGTQSRASGPISYMRVFDRSCETVESAGARRGAQMGMLRVDHPDILDFIRAKDVREVARRLRAAGLSGRDLDQQLQSARTLSNFNLSVAVTDEFMRAKAEGRDIELVHAAEPDPAEHPDAYRREDGKWVYRRVAAQLLWDEILQMTYDTADPGVIFIDRANLENNLSYLEVLEAVNPCGEQFLPPYGCCCLGSINLARLVNDPFTENARLDYTTLRGLARTAVRMLDDVLDVTYWPLPEQRREAQNKRRLGLGFTGLGTALMMLRIRYGSEEGVATAAQIARELRDAAYRASIDLAGERGAFPLLDREKYLATPFIQRLPDDIRAGIRAHGIRNSHLLSIAPTGTISLAFGRNVTGGIEPAFAWEYTRKTRDKSGAAIEYPIQDYGYRLYLGMGGDKEHLPSYFANAQTLAPSDHLRMQAAVQPYVDSSISKCVLKGTRIMTNHGLVRIEDLGAATQADTFARARPDTTVLGRDGRWHRVLRHYCGGRRPTISARLANGQVLTGSENHRLMGPDGWVRMADLKSGDHIMLRRDCAVALPGGAELPSVFIPRGYRYNRYRAPRHMSPDLALFLGMMCADGHLQRSNGHISLCAGTDSLGSLFGKLCKSLFAAEPTHTVDPRTGVHQWAFNSKPLCQWLTDLMGERSHNKRVPEALFSGSASEIEGFLRGVSLDGFHVDNGGREWTVLYEGRSETLARGIFSLCMMWGRNPSLTTKDVPSHGYRTFGVRVPGFTGALEPHKDSRHSNLDFLVRIPVDPVVHRVPSRQAGYFTLRNWWQRKARVAKESSVRALGLTPEPHVHFVRVAEVTRGEGDVFDIEVEDVHEYLVDGIVSHNTVNVPVDAEFDDFKRVYDLAYEWGCKGCTTYRPNDVTGAVLTVPVEAVAHPTLALEPLPLDRRLKLEKAPTPPLSSLKWPSRPEFARGNPAWTYLVDAGPGCRFAVFVGHVENGDIYPFEVWVNGAEQPRGLGATAKLLSMDMRSRDRAWLKLKLETLIRTRGNPVMVAMPPTGQAVTMASPTAALARLVQLRCQELGAFDQLGSSPVLDALLSVDEPKTGTDGTMSWTVDVKNPATGDDAVLVLKELQMPDGQRRPYAAGLYGDYPRDLDGLCRLLSLDMRIIDPAWIGEKLRKLVSFPEAGGAFMGRVPGEDRAQTYPSTVAYLAALMLHRYAMLGILDADGAPLKPLGVLEPPAAARSQAMLGAPCPDCGAHAVVRHEGCQSCTSCGWIGNCG